MLSTLLIWICRHVLRIELRRYVSWMFLSDGPILGVQDPRTIRGRTSSGEIPSKLCPQHDTVFTDLSPATAK